MEHLSISDKLFFYIAKCILYKRIDLVAEIYELFIALNLIIFGNMLNDEKMLRYKWCDYF